MMRWVNVISPNCEELFHCCLLDSSLVTSALFDSIFQKLEDGRRALGEGLPAWSMDYFDRLFQLIDDEHEVFRVIGGMQSSPEFRFIMRDKIEGFFIEKRFRLHSESADNQVSAELYATAGSSIIIGLLGKMFIRPERFTREKVCQTYRDVLLHGAPPFRSKGA